MEGYARKRTWGSYLPCATVPVSEVIIEPIDVELSITGLFDMIISSGRQIS
jgi:hypothetical protein